MHDVIVVGAGPAGLAAAIAAGRAGLTCLVIEKGALVNSILNFPRNMVFFSSPELLEVGGLPFTTPFDKPTRAEALRYYRRVAEVFRLEILFGEEVVSVLRGPAFRIVTRRADGTGSCHESAAVVLAIGYFDHPNMLGIPGEDLPHVSHYYIEAHPYFRRRVVVVGGKN